MMRKPLTKAETDALNSVLERAAQRLERRKRRAVVSYRDDPRSAQQIIEDNWDDRLTGVLAALKEEPREG